MEQLHLAILVVHWIWDALVAYANTPAGEAGLADIEAVVSAIENPGTVTGQPTGSASASSQASSGPQIIRK